jgi:uncharacterized protein involved in exopolysaccharide biosynthesis
VTTHDQPLSAGLRSGRILDGPEPDQGLFEWVLVPWRRYLTLPMLVAVVAGGITFLVPNKYRAVAQLYPEQRTAPGPSNLGAFAGLAQQFGVGLASGAQSPQFYVQVLGSRRLMEDVLRALVAVAGQDSISLMSYLDDTEEESERDERAVLRLRDATEASVNARTNIVEIAVTLKNREVAAQVVALYIQALNRFNLVTRQSQAGQRRRFVEKRLAESQDSLVRVDEEIRAFLTRNRQYRDSPSLAFEYEQLQRKLSSFQQLTTGLRSDFDTARLDEVNDTPVLSVVDPPRVPIRKSSPNRAFAVLAGGALGLLTVLMWAALRAFVGRMKLEQPSQFDSMNALRERIHPERGA